MRRRPRSRLFAIAIVLVAAVAPSLLRADEEAIAFHWVRGEGAETCPTSSAMSASIVRRLGSDPFRAGAARSLEGWAERKERAFHLHLVFRRSDGSIAWSRDLSSDGNDCRSVADAAALAVAALLGPEVPAVIDAGGGNESAEASAADGADAGRDEAGPALASPRTRRPRDASMDPEAPSGSLEVRALAATGLLPELAPGAELATRVPLSRRLAIEVSGVWLSETATDDRRFAFGLTGVSAGPCAELPLARSVFLSACARLDAGVVHGVVQRVEPSRPGERWWLAASAGPRVRWRLVGPLHVAAGLTMLVNILRYEFVSLGTDGRDVPIFEQPLFALMAYGSAGVSFR